MRKSAPRAALVAIALLAPLLWTAACQPDTDLTAPPDDASAAGDAAAGDGTGMSVRVSPRAAMVFSRVGQPARTIDFSAQLLDDSGDPAVPPPPGMQWTVAVQGGAQLGETDVSNDSLTAMAKVQAGRGGRDTVFARAAGHSGYGAITNWEWVKGSWSGPDWLVPGQSGCLELTALDSGGNAVRLPDFDYIFRQSFDPEVLAVDSMVFSPDGTATQVCVTGGSVGRGRLGVSAWDTTTFKYVGEYAQYNVLQPPLVVSLESPEWELGVGQSHPLSLVLTDARGTAVPINREWVDSWDVSDASMLAIEDGVLTAKTSGSGEFSVTYLEQEVAASVEVYGIVEGRFNTDVMCIVSSRP